MVNQSCLMKKKCYILPTSKQIKVALWSVSYVYLSNIAEVMCIFAMSFRVTLLQKTYSIYCARDK